MDDPSKPHIEIGRRLQDERKRLGLTQEELAEEGGVKLGSQYLYEKGKRSPTAEYLVNIKEAGVDIAFVLGLTDEPHTDKGELAQKKRFLEQALQLFSQTDKECRDPNGALLEFNYRFSKFKKLVHDYLFGES